MFRKDTINKKQSLYKTYYSMLFTWIVIPILLVFIVSMAVLGHRYREKSLGQIKQMQNSLVTELHGDINRASLLLSSMVFANNNEILQFAEMTDTNDLQQKNNYREKLKKMENLYLEPDKDICSMYFFMKDGKETYLKDYVKRDRDEVKNESWYKEALKNKNHITVGSYQTRGSNDVLVGGKKDMFILVFTLSPKTGENDDNKVEAVQMYQSIKAANQIRQANKAYIKGGNQLGLTRIVSDKGKTVYEPDSFESMKKGGKTVLVTDTIDLANENWIVETVVYSKDLARSFYTVAAVLMAVLVVVILFVLYYSRIFVKGIVRPIGVVNEGLRKMEDGELDVHITATGQDEIRSMIHQFNAMSRRMKAMVDEYEKKLQQNVDGNLVFRSLVENKSENIDVLSKEKREGIFEYPYVLIHLNLNKGKSREELEHLMEECSTNPKFVSRCYYHIENKGEILLFYKVVEEDYHYGIKKMIMDIQRMSMIFNKISVSAIVGKAENSGKDFYSALNELKSLSNLHLISNEDEIIFLDEPYIVNLDNIVASSAKYDLFAETLYAYDVKNAMEEKEKLFQSFNHMEVVEIQENICALVLAIGKEFEKSNDSIYNLFGQQYNYIEKIVRNNDKTSLKMWVTNFTEWVMNYSQGKLGIKESDAITKAKHFIAQNYNNPDLSLKMVADEVGLNEKYFTNQFTKKENETFSEYLMKIRVQKAKELLSTTNFKVYEVAEMVGYNSSEHFTRVFKKIEKISPSQYRKS